MICSNATHYRNGVVRALAIQIDEQDETIKKLSAENAELLKFGPKKGLIEQLEGLKVKNGNQKKTIAVRNIEIERLKQIDEKYKDLLRKFGPVSVRSQDHNSRDEIIAGMGDENLNYYHHYASKKFTELETVNLMNICFLDLSGAARYTLINRLLKFSSFGVRSSVHAKIDKEVKEKLSEMKVKIAKNDDNDNLIVPNDVAVAGTSKVDGTSRVDDTRVDDTKVAGIKRVGECVSTSGPDHFDPSWDNFGKEKFLHDDNRHCKFVRTSSVTFIAASSDPNRLFAHKLDAPVACGIPDCDAIFELGVSIIGRAVICAPENHHKYGHAPLVCRKHILQSVDTFDDVDFERAAIEHEDAIFNASEAHEKPLRDIPNPDEIFYSEEEPEATNTIGDFLSQDTVIMSGNEEEEKSSMEEIPVDDGGVQDQTGEDAAK